jgi:hypothetical protein
MLYCVFVLTRAIKFFLQIEIANWVHDSVVAYVKLCGDRWPHLKLRPPIRAAKRTTVERRLKAGLVYDHVTSRTPGWLNLTETQSLELGRRVTCGSGAVCPDHPVQQDKAFLPVLPEFLEQK